MKERPILFSAPLVRAVLDGSKRVTRRPMKVQTKGHFIDMIEESDGTYVAVFSDVTVKCPYGKPGDRLWGRETWGVHWMYNGVPPRDIYRGDDGGDCTFYRADGHVDGGCSLSQCTIWRPSIHMPRWASRLTLPITHVTPERLRDITEAQAKLEGVEPLDAQGLMPYTAGFARDWDAIYRPRPGRAWTENPWVWAISFDDPMEADL